MGVSILLIMGRFLLGMGVVGFIMHGVRTCVAVRTVVCGHCQLFVSTHNSCVLRVAGVE
jgi:hypothetical protein